jgi:hypothetical protein
MFRGRRRKPIRTDQTKLLLAGAGFSRNKFLLLFAYQRALVPVKSRATRRNREAQQFVPRQRNHVLGFQPTNKLPAATRRANFSPDWWGFAAVEMLPEQSGPLLDSLSYVGFAQAAWRRPRLGTQLSSLRTRQTT